MQCPYFKKINFQKIEQRMDTQEDFDKSLPWEKTRYFQNMEIESYQQQIPEQGCTNNIKVQQYKNIWKQQSFQSQQQEMEELDKVITIKMPKALKYKQLNIVENIKQSVDENINVKRTQNQKYHNMTNLMKQKKYVKQPQLQEIEQQISCQSPSQLKQKSTKVFSTKRNFFFENSFYSAVLLPKTNQYCFCQLDETVLKIITIGKGIKLDSPEIYATSQQIRKQTNTSYKYPNSKIKYFIQIRKFKIDLFCINSTTLQIRIKSNYPKQSFLIQFMTQNERCTFECVYSSIIDQSTGINSQLVQKNNLQENHNKLSQTLKSERSIDSLKFFVQRMIFKEANNFLDTFDLILFKGKNIMCKVQRFFTNSDFDHIALVIKTVGSNILLFEATGNVGVAIYSFASVQMAIQKKLYQRIAIRKYSNLNQFSIQERARKLVALQQFVEQANGKKYKFDPLYLISSTVNKGQGSKQKSMQQTYFCSELVAQALKVCGIMKNVKPSYKYLPKHFGDRQDLNNQLLPGYFYSDSIILEK